MNDLCQKHDSILLDFWFGESVAQEDVDRALAVCDIEVLGALRALILAYAMQKYPQLDFGRYAAPRLKGVLDFYRFSNIRFLAHLAPLAALLEKAGIQFLPGPDLTLKMLRPETPRPLPGLELLSPKATLEHCRDALRESPYELCADGYSIEVLHGQDVIGRIRCDLPGFTNGNRRFEKIWNDARPVRCGARSFPCPMNTDILQLLLAEATRRIASHAERHALIFSVTDVAWIVGQLRDEGQNIDESFFSGAFAHARAFFRKAAPRVFYGF